MIDEDLVYEEFQKALYEALLIYGSTDNVTYQSLNMFIEDRVWDSVIKYNRMTRVTKEKFFENLYKRTPLDEYAKGVYELWDNVDHTYMDKAIEELNKMVIQKDFNNAELYGNKKITEKSIKLENYWREYKIEDKELYTLNRERDFRTIENRYANRHVKLYENILNRYKDSNPQDLANFVKEYDKLDNMIPYFSHLTGEIIRFVDIGTYLSMLYNVNLTRSAWNRTIYDSKLLGNHLFYLRAHPYACPHCMKYQGYVYTDHDPTPRELNILNQYGKLGYFNKESTLEDEGRSAIGHPNCKHVWLLYWSPEQIQEEKYNSEEWEEKYKNKQKIQSLQLKKSRLLSDRRIYKELGQQDLYDKTTEKIKRIRTQIKELEQ